MQILIEAGFASKVLDRITTSEQRKYNKEIIKKISKIFGEGFGRFIAKKMPDLASKISLIKVFSDYEDGNEEPFKVLFADLLINYYVYISKPSFFSGNVSGSKKIDIAFSGAIEKFLSSKIIKNDIIDRIPDFLKTQIPEILGTIDEAKKTNFNPDSINKGINWVRAKGNKEKYARLQFRDGVLKYFPSIDGGLRKKINDAIDDADISKLTKIMNDGVSLQEAIDVTAEIIIPFMTNAMYKMNIQKTPLEEFGKYVYRIAKSKEMEKQFRKHMRFHFQ